MFVLEQDLKCHPRPVRATWVRAPDGVAIETTYLMLMKRTLLLLVAVMAAGALSASAADAKALYEKQCAKCHGADGKGETKMGKKNGAKDYTSAKVQDALKDEDALKALKKGVKDKDGKEVMKPSEDLSDSDAKAVVAYMRTFKK